MKEVRLEVEFLELSQKALTKMKHFEELQNRSPFEEIFLHDFYPYRCNCLCSVQIIDMGDIGQTGYRSLASCVGLGAQPICLLSIMFGKRLYKTKS